MVHNHYQYRHYVDDHNSKRHQPISLEVVWATHDWSKRVFAFLLAVTEVNVKIASKYFGGQQDNGMLDFRRCLAKELIENGYLLLQDQKPCSSSHRRSSNNEHMKMTLPKRRKFSGTEMVFANSDYPQATCNGCGKKTRTFCKCSPGTYRCDNCVL